MNLGAIDCLFCYEEPFCGVRYVTAPITAVTYQWMINSKREERARNGKGEREMGQMQTKYLPAIGREKNVKRFLTRNKRMEPRYYRKTNYQP